MPNVFHDRFIDFQQYDINLNDNIFEQLLATRKNEFDSERFFLKFIQSNDLAKYNFNDKSSLSKFRDDCCTFMSPLKKMGGCNLRPEKLEEDIKYAGIKLSDPNGKIIGQFDIRNHIVTYSPIFPFFYEERDLIKFANDTYFTSLSFEQLIMNQIDHAIKYYIHIGNYYSPKDIVKYGNYIMEEVSKEKMIEYATNPELGNKILKKIK